MNDATSVPADDPEVLCQTAQHDGSEGETAYLMSSPLNARRLLASIDELEAGGGTVHDLIEP